MTVIDQFVDDNRDRMSIKEMAAKAGVSYELIRYRKNLLDKNPLPAIEITPHDDLEALVNFINVRQSGCLVDIAIQRVIDLNKRINNL